MSSLWPVSGSADDILGLLRDWESADEAAPLVVETSGSTGRPKRVVLSRAAMRASADATHERLGGPGQWVLNLPPTHVAGLQVLFRSVRARTEPVLGEDLLAALTSMGGHRRFVSLVPTQLAWALGDTGTVEALAKHDAVLVGGGPLAAAVRAEAEGLRIRIVQTYGMSETCGGCVYDGVPLPGVDVRVDSGGEVLLRGPMLFDGYLGEPERTADVLRDGWFRTDDRGSFDELGRLRILGRTDDVVISGGVKVPVVAVEQQLLEHPDVVDVAVAGVTDPTWGERVVALVSVEDRPPTLESLRDLVSPRAWAPKQIVVVDDLPRLPNGKVDRVAVRMLAADG